MRVMLARVMGCAVVGLVGEPVSVEVDIAPTGLPAFNIVGLPDAAVSEAKERVRAAIRNAGATFPQKRITVNLAPADLRKEGSGYDLPIAAGILVASEQMPAARLRPDRFSRRACSRLERYGTYRVRCPSPPWPATVGCGASSSAPSTRPRPR